MGKASWDLTPRQLCDLELLTTGAFAPLTGFQTRADVESVGARMRLADGTLWPIPIELDVDAGTAARLTTGQPLALRDPEGVRLAVLHVDEVWPVDRATQARDLFGTLDCAHPGVEYLLSKAGPWSVGGRVEVVEPPTHHDFRSLRLTPAAARAEFARRGWSRIVAFQTRNPLHRAHHALTIRAMRQLDAGLLIHPVVGMTKPGDVEAATRVRCYQAVMPHYPAGSAMLALLPLAMRMGGPREALWHGLIRRNFGCTHFIVGRDHAGPGIDGAGKPFYDPYEAQELFRRHEDEIGIQMVPFQELSYAAERDEYLTQEETSPGATVLNLSGTDLRRRLREGRDIPEWFTFSGVAEELRRAHPPRSRQGFTVFFSGLSGSGKSTIANALRVALLERGGRSVTLLDGDVVRKHLSSELGFSREHRDLNIRRIGFVAAEVTRAGGVAICAPIAPYDATRKDVRREIEAAGGFVLVHVSTPLDVCEARDRKGLYARARAGQLPAFTGISDPYEPPTDAELTIDASATSPAGALALIVDRLEREGYI